MQNRKALQRTADQWASTAFPPEASRSYGEPKADVLRERQEQLRKDNAGRSWELVAGIDFPYDRYR